MSDPGGNTVPTGNRNHRRFALTEVTFESQPVGGATVDMWYDSTGVSRWSVRAVMPWRDMPADGVISGLTRDGRVLRGPVTFVGQETALKGRGSVLLEWHGVGPLVAVEPAQEH